MNIRQSGAVFSISVALFLDYQNCDLSQSKSITDVTAVVYSTNVKDSEMPIADWLPYPTPLNIYIGFGLNDHDFLLIEMSKNQEKIIYFLFQSTWEGRQVSIA